MAAYVITDVEITDADLYGQFREQVTATVGALGGKFIARGGALEVISGDWKPKRFAIMELSSIEQANAWLNSPEYTALDDILTTPSNINMVVVDAL